MRSKKSLQIDLRSIPEPPSDKSLAMMCAAVWTGGNLSTTLTPDAGRKMEEEKTFRSVGKSHREASSPGAAPAAVVEKKRTTLGDPFYRYALRNSP